MALSFTEATIAGRTIEYIDIGTDALILKGNLSAKDAVHLEAALAESSLGDYNMPNGQQTAAEYFTPMTRTLAEITAQYQNAEYRKGAASTLADHATTLADHEARITALEP